MSTFSAKSFQYASSNVTASPGVSLERGNYRMRAPNVRPLPSLLEGHSVPIIRSPQRRANRHLAFLVVLLAASCFTCFGYAYYLFSSRWAIRPNDLSIASANSTTQVTGSEYPLAHPQKFLSYLPHSGFHNQRIAFENALVLAYALRRTLLVPPIRLGNKPIRYVEYDTLFQYHELSDKEGLKHCPQIPRSLSLPSECHHYFESSFLPWTWLVNLSTINAQQTLFHLPNMSRPWIHANFDIGSNDVHTLRDISAYQFRFVDNSDTPPRGKYEKDIFIDQLNAVPEKLLQIGTLFGTARLHLRNPRNLAYRAAVRQSMAFTNERLSQVANSIARVLQPSYIAVHIRSGDGLFQSMGEHTVNFTWWKMLHEVLGLSIPDICELEKSSGTQASSRCIFGHANSGLSTSTWMGSPTTLFPLPSPSLEMKCMGNMYLEQRYRQLNTPLYVATDLSKPKTNPLLSVFRQTFPCTFFLEDFKSELAPLKQMASPYDGVELYDFVLPFVDALVAGSATRVVGTKGSTFSKFIEDILWASQFHKGDASR